MDDQPGATAAPGKRGRKQSLADRARGPVAEFAHALGTLKVQAGDPSYEQMRLKLGATASKSALSAAARGRELPSWETTWEFVRCLAPPDADLDDHHRKWRARWEAARQGVSVAPGSPPPLRPEPASSPRPAPPDRHPYRLLAVGLIVGALAVGGLLVVLPGKKAQIPPIEGDATKFVVDVTIPDGTAVAVGERFVKTWEIRNAGTVPWNGRFLMRQPDAEGTNCRTPDRVAVPDTEPGRPVRISVVVDAAAPGHCKVRWKMIDEQGRAYFPYTRPVFFDVTVAG